MGLFDMFKKKAAAPAAPAKPANVDADPAPYTLCAPVSGRAIKMTDVPDPVFGGEMMGKGCAVYPDCDVVCAPIAGTVGAGGLGDIAVRYGHQRFITSVMWVTVVILIIMVQIVQSLFGWLSKKIDKRLDTSKQTDFTQIAFLEHFRHIK